VVLIFTLSVWEQISGNFLVFDIYLTTNPNSNPQSWDELLNGMQKEVIQVLHLLLI